MMVTIMKGTQRETWERIPGVVSRYDDETLYIIKAGETAETAIPCKSIDGWAYDPGTHGPKVAAPIEAPIERTIWQKGEPE